MGDQARFRSRSRWLDEVRGGGPSSSTTAGKLAAQAWLRSRALDAPALTPWHVEVTLGLRDVEPTAEFDDRTDTRFRLEIYSEEWGFFYCHQGHASWIRITDIPFVHGRDDFGLLAQTPALKDIGPLLRAIEHRHGLRFSRAHVLVRTNVPGADAAARQWVRAL